MPKRALLASLEELRNELSGAGDLDSETRKQLAELADTIDDTLDAPEPDYASVHTNVRELAIRFEAGHPRFARILADVTDALAKLGL